MKEKIILYGLTFGSRSDDTNVVGGLYSAQNPKSLMNLGIALLVGPVLLA
jgi:hypothetical protein